MARPGTSPGDIAGIAFAVALLALFVVTPAEAMEPPPATPEIRLLMATKTSVFESQSTEMYCVAHHEDGAPLTYTWSTDGGTLLAATDSAIWFAPVMAGTYAVSVDVSDDAGATATERMLLTVLQNEPPTVTELTAEPPSLLPGQSSTLTCIAQDPEGHALDYEWRGPSGELNGEGPTVTWTAPARPGHHNILVIATDELGASRTANVMIEVLCPDPPSIEEVLVWPTLPDYTKEDIRGGFRLLRGSLTRCELECVAVTPYGAVTYEWSTTAGTIDGRGPVVLFTPPNEITEVRVTVRVRDVCGQFAEEKILFHVFRREAYTTEVDSVPACMRCLRGYGG